jgi:hypothetical protein
MIANVFVALSLLSMAMAQLSMIQYVALMDVYASLGSCSLHINPTR